MAVLVRVARISEVRCRLLAHHALFRDAQTGRGAGVRYAHKRRFAHVAISVLVVPMKQMSRLNQ
jgi:hypothetical protein